MKTFLKNYRNKAMQRLSLMLLCVVLFLSGQVKALAQNDNKPNVVYINVDDLGYGDLSVYGATKVETPNIDKLASQGMRFTDAHTVSAVCTPSRYAFITGEYPVRANNLSSAIFDRDSLLINPEKLTVADVFKEQGYATGIVGK